MFTRTSKKFARRITQVAAVAGICLAAHASSPAQIERDAAQADESFSAGETKTLAGILLSPQTRLIIRYRRVSTA